MKKFLLLLLMLSLNHLAFSQEEEEEESNEDSFEIVEEDDSFELDLGEDFSVGSIFSSHPMIRVEGGMSNPTYLGEDLGELDHLRIIMGFSKFKTKEYKDEAKLREYSDYGFLIENYNHRSDILTDYTGDEKQFSFWKFGYATSEGLGYIIGENSDIILGQESGFGWQKLNYSYSTPSSTMGIPILEDLDGDVDPRYKLENVYGDDVRFSQYYQAFIKIRPIKNLSIDFGYQQDLIFPRYMFWYAAGSGIVEGAGQFLLEKFADKITKSSPYVGPIVHFIFKNALAYTFMELRKDDMNWPIDGANPLIINSMNLGVNFHF